MDPKVAALKRKRYELLKALYDKTNADPSQWIEDTELQNDLGLSRQEYTPMILELKSKRLVKVSHEAAAIDFPGIAEVERIETDPDQDSDYFPARNVMYVEHISQSQIQQGSYQSAQSMQLTNADLQPVSEFIEKLGNALNSLGLDPEEEKQAKADIATVRAQASSTRPNRVIIKESLLSLRRMLEAAAAGAAAVPAGDLLRKLLQAIWPRLF
jgi:hypothetical protein